VLRYTPILIIDIKSPPVKRPAVPITIGRATSRI